MHIASFLGLHTQKITNPNTHIRYVAFVPLLPAGLSIAPNETLRRAHDDIYNGENFNL